MKRKKETQNLFIKGCQVFIIGFFMVTIHFIIGHYRHWLDQSESFLIKHIEISGNELLSDKEILKQGNLDYKECIWHVNLIQFEKGLERNPFVADVQIKRLFPNSIHIIIQEKQPLALLNFKGKFHCIDQEGLVLPSRPGRLYDLPVISGAFEGSIALGSYVSGKHVWSGLQFLQMVIKDRPRLYTEISEIVVGKSKGLILYTRQGAIPVLMGKENQKRKIRYLEAILSELDQSKTFTNVKYIDIRFQGQVVLGMRT